jgi:hypothetical protein
MDNASGCLYGIHVFTFRTTIGPGASLVAADFWTAGETMRFVWWERIRPVSRIGTATYLIDDLVVDQIQTWGIESEDCSRMDPEYRERTGWL